MNHIPPKSVKLVNVADENAIVSAFNENADKKAAVVTWNPFLVDVRNAKGSTMVADSSKIPGEIVDMIVVRKDAPEAFKKALAGAWYETVALVEHGGPERMKAMQFFATAMGQTVPQTEAQLRTTAMFYTPKAASEFTEAADLKRVMGLIQSFAKEATAQGTMSAKGAENVGIKFPDGTVIGNSKNVRLIFSSTYMRMAEKGELK
jgi:NitT/TauT family transport system substrate-binding protein